MKGLICECRNAIRLTAMAGVSAIFAGADTAARTTAPKVMRKVLGTENVMMRRTALPVKLSPLSPCERALQP